MNKVIYALLVIALFVLSCSQGTKVVGTGSESPNALTGRVLDNTSPIIPSRYSGTEGAVVSLYSITETFDSTNRILYDWSKTDSSTTDSEGEFCFKEPNVGYYSIIIQQGNKKAFSGYFRIISRDTLLDLGEIILEQTLNVKGTIKDTSVAANLFQLGLVGTPFIDTCNVSGGFTFDSIPKGFMNFDIRQLQMEKAINSIFYTSADMRSLTHDTTNSDLVNVFTRASHLATWPVDSTVVETSPNKTKLTVNHYTIEYTSTINQ